MTNEPAAQPLPAKSPLRERLEGVLSSGRLTLDTRALLSTLIEDAAIAPVSPDASSSVTGGVVLPEITFSDDSVTINIQPHANPDALAGLQPRVLQARKDLVEMFGLLGIKPDKIDKDTGAATFPVQRIIDTLAPLMDAKFTKGQREKRVVSLLDVHDPLRAGSYVAAVGGLRVAGEETAQGC